MPGTVIHEGWRAAQAESRYPFADGCSLASSGGLVLPRKAFLDAAVYPPSPGPFRVSAVRVSADEVAVDVAAAGRDALATASLGDTIDVVTPLTTPEGRPAGVFVLDPSVAAALRAWPRGTHEFRPGTADLVASVCSPGGTAGLAGVRVGDVVLTGEVVVVGEEGVVFSVEDDDGSGVRVVRFDVVGDPLFFRARCEPALQEEGGPSAGVAAKSYLKRLVLKAQVGEAGGPQVVDLVPDGLGGVVLSPLVDPDAASPTALRVSVAGGSLKFTLAGAPERTK